MVGVNVLIPFTLSAFLVPLQHAFGWNRTEISLGSTIVTLGTTLGVVLAGLMMRWVAIRPLIASGLLAGALGFWALAHLDGAIANFWSILGVVSVLAGGCSPATLTRLVVGGFVRRRGLALGITLLGPGLVAALAPPLLIPLIGTHGWRSGYIALCVVSLMTLPLILLLLTLKRHQPDPAPVPDLAVPALA
jgi:MFS family permease